MSELSLEIDTGPIRAIPVPPSSADQLLLSGSGKLYGWSLIDASGVGQFAVAGAVVAPAASAVIASQAIVPAGVFTVRWNVGLQGAAAAADTDNFALQVNGVTQVISDNPGVAGEYLQQEIDVVLTANSTVRVIAIGAGTAAVTYTVQLEIVPPVRSAVLFQLLDGGNILGVGAVAENDDTTAWFGPQGVRIFNQIRFHPVSGIVTGCVYAAYDRELFCPHVSMSSR